MAHDHASPSVAHDHASPSVAHDHASPSVAHDHAHHTFPATPTTAPSRQRWR